MTYLPAISLAPRRTIRRAPHVPRVARVSRETLRCLVTGADCGSLRREMDLGGRITLAIDVRGTDHVAVGRGRNLREAACWLLHDLSGGWPLAADNREAIALVDAFLRGLNLRRSTA